MSAITSKARSRCWSRKREYTDVVSLPVPALISAPMPSKIWSISVELKRFVPLNSRCSRKCETPASSTVSSREPVRTQKPRAMERTVSIRSDTTRRPEPSSVTWGRSGVTRSSAAIASVVAVAAVALAAVTPASVASATPTAVAAAAPRAVAAALVAGPDRGQLLGGLAGDLRVVGQPEADPAALLVDLDHAHVDLVAAVQHVLNRLGPLAGRDVRDVQQAVGALRELDERAERGRLDDLAGVLVADLDLLGHLADALDQRVALGPCLGVDQDGAVLLHVDLRLELLGQRADRLAALADDHAELVCLDLDRADPRRELGQLAAWLGEDGVHLAEDELAPGLRLLQRVAQDVERDA